MLNITLHKEVSENINEELILNKVRAVFSEKGISQDAEASVSIVYHSKVVELAVLYMKETPEEAKDHPVLSFLNSELESEFIFPPDNIHHIGEIVVSYDKAVQESKFNGLSVDETIAYWAEHGALHLMEVHHD